MDEDGVVDEARGEGDEDVAVELADGVADDALDESNGLVGLLVGHATAVGGGEHVGEGAETHHGGVFIWGFAAG